MKSYKEWLQEHDTHQRFPITDNSINSVIVKAFDKVIEASKTNHDNNYQDFVAKTLTDYLKEHLTNINVSSEGKCKIKSDCSLSDPNNLDKNTFYVINNPTNIQSWPDIALVYNNRAMVVEVKTSKNDKIKWNSGTIKKNCLYVYKNTRTMEVSLFMGYDKQNDSEQFNDDTIKKFKKEVLEFALSLLKTKYQELNTQNLQYDIRNVWNDNIKYTKHDKRDAWFSEAKNYIANFDWGL